MNMQSQSITKARALYRSLRDECWRRLLNFRDVERRGLLERPTYAYGLLRAADIAKFFGYREVTVCEFGVAAGDGLLNMIELADRISSETEIRFRIVGFDTGNGLPPLNGGYKDHPEIWAAGDYPMRPDELQKRIDGRAELILGDIRDTVPPFIERLSASAPLGFISVDVDIYTSTRDALKVLLGPAELYTGAVSVYFDDVRHFFANRWCGELAAIEEFNAEHPLRKLDVDYSRRHFDKPWFSSFYICHLLDHPIRNAPNPDRKRFERAGGNLPQGVLD